MIFLQKKFAHFAKNSYLCKNYTNYMQKRYIISLFVAALMSVAVQAASPMVMKMEMGVAELMEQDKGVSISIDNNVVRVSGAAGMTLEVVSLTGRPVTTVKIDSPNQRVELNLPKGCYILKVGKVVRKVTLR